MFSFIKPRRITLKVRFDPGTVSSVLFGDSGAMGSIVKDPEKYGLSK